MLPTVEAVKLKAPSEWTMRWHWEERLVCSWLGCWEEGYLLSKTHYTFAKDDEGE